MYLVSIFIVIFASVGYHLTQKSISPTVNPMVSIIITYLVSILISLILIPLVYPIEGGLVESLKKVNWASIALAFSLVGLEVGFLLVYRSGWKISLAAVITNVAAAMILIPVGIWIFHEKVTPINLIGVIVCILGLILVNWK
jgi:drug/metabolite transporter (DMT)-like permease